MKLLDEMSRRASFTYSLEVKDWSGLVERGSIFMQINRFFAPAPF